MSSTRGPFLKQVASQRYRLWVGHFNFHVPFSLSAVGQKQTFSPVRRMSGLPPKADIRRHRCNALLFLQMPFVSL